MRSSYAARLGMPVSASIMACCCSCLRLFCRLRLSRSSAEMRVRMRCRALAIGLGARFFARVEFLHVRGDRMQPAGELLAQLRDVVRALRAGANLLHFARHQQVELRRVVLRGVAFRELSREMRLDLVEPRGGLLHQVLELEPLALHLRALLVCELRDAIQQIDEILRRKAHPRCRLRSSGHELVQLRKQGEPCRARGSGPPSSVASGFLRQCGR